MINEENVKLMTRMAAYEKDKGKKNKKIISFFKRDYISMQMLKSIVCTTLVFGIVFALYILYDFELFMKEIYQMDLFQFAKSVILIYMVLLGIALVVTHIVALYQYNKALQGTKIYYANLKRLSQSYGKED